MKKNETIGLKDTFALQAEIAPNSDSILVTGEVSYKAYDKHDNEVYSFHGKNLVVTLGKQAICKLLAEGTAGKLVTQFGCGTSAGAPALTDVAPLTDQFKKAIGGFSYPSTSSVKFDWTLEFAQANGFNLNEFGLFCVDNTLFSRVVAGPIAKTSGVRLVGSWVINFL